MYYVTFSFDDGFEKSTIKTAEIFESFGLRTEFNVIATAHLNKEKVHGDFSLWNELQSRGHIIQPHGYNHTDKTSVPFEQATGLIDTCLEYFNEHLRDFHAKETIFCFPHNSSNKQLEEWISKKVRAFRTGYNKVINPLPTKETKIIYGDCWPDTEKQIENTLELFFKQSPVNRLAERTAVRHCHANVIVIESAGQHLYATGEVVFHDVL